LQQIVWNLVSNAIKFTPKGGRIRVRLRRSDSHAEIEVADSGQGISAEFLPYVFDRFRQADSSTTRRHGGLGLGLSIVRHLVEMHGGTVHAASEGEGRGASFIVRLPLISMRESEPYNAVSIRELRPVIPTPVIERASDAKPVERLDGVRVLVVEDEEDARETVKVLLEGHGADVKISASVEEALETLSRWKPDVLVSDIGMPNEDGYALIERVRAIEDRYKIPIPALALTGYARPEDRSRLLRAGYRLHLAKPVEMAELVAAILNLAAQQPKKSRTSAE
jgi:CheY-like chemotaxis protein